jgi:multiple sugar transport system ATP-binding protein
VVVEPTGAETLVFCTLAGEPAQAVFRERHAFRPGERIHLAPQLESVHLFDAETGRRL